MPMTTLLLSILRVTVTHPTAYYLKYLAAPFAPIVIAMGRHPGPAKDDTDALGGDTTTPTLDEVAMGSTDTTTDTADNFPGGLANDSNSELTRPTQRLNQPQIMTPPDGAATH